MSGNFQELVLEVSDSKPVQSTSTAGEESSLSKAGVHPFTYKIAPRSQQHKAGQKAAEPLLSEQSVRVSDAVFSQTHDAFAASTSKAGELLLTNQEAGRRLRFSLARLGRIRKLEDSDRDNSLFYLSEFPTYPARRSFGSLSRGRLTFECPVRFTTLRDIMVLQNHLVILATKSILIYSLRSGDLCTDFLEVKLSSIGIRSKRKQYRHLRYSSNAVILYSKRFGGKTYFLRADHLLLGKVTFADIRLVSAMQRIPGDKYAEFPIVDTLHLESEKDVWTNVVLMKYPESHLLRFFTYNMINSRSEIASTSSFSLTDLLDFRLFL